jgi:hypothetical protein
MLLPLPKSPQRKDARRQLSSNHLSEVRDIHLLSLKAGTITQLDACIDNPTKLLMHLQIFPPWSGLLDGGLWNSSLFSRFLVRLL